eukprot:SAG11_NODE_2735_length_3028_cov_4.580061_2_plen_145_part_00
MHGIRINLPCTWLKLLICITIVLHATLIHRAGLTSAMPNEKPACFLVARCCVTFAVFVSYQSRRASAEMSCDFLGSDIEATIAEVGWENYHVDHTPAEHGPGHDGILLDGIQFAKGIFAHAPSRVVFALGGACESCTTRSITVP